MNKAKNCKSTLFECPERVVTLRGAGSGRRYQRNFYTDSESGKSLSVIMTEGTNTEENRRFVGLSRFFKANHVNVPDVYDITPDGFRYYQQDLGDISLLDIIRGNSGEDTEQLMRNTIDQLITMQTVDVDELIKTALGEDFTMTPELDRTAIMWDLNYFKYEFLKPSGLEFDEWRLEAEFQRLADSLSLYPRELRGFMMRDCQSRNVMIHDGEPYLIDYQGGRIGPMIYDVVCLLWHARAGFDEQFRQRMLSYYAHRLSSEHGIPHSEILEGYERWLLLRQLQVLGAYGLRGLIERKSQFVESIPEALEMTRATLAGKIGEEYPYLKEIISKLQSLPRFQRQEIKEGLTVTVYSFSYRKGYPEDLSGNGGGFMFDCRALHNPGRYEEYKQKTGLDADVKKFLEDRGEVYGFIESAEALVFPAIERYAQRGFTSLQVGFGCTGGQHRSVYCAQKVSEEIVRRFADIHVRLVHREQGIDKILS